MTSGTETKSAIHSALRIGYRAFDSAQMYHNEADTGAAIQSFLSSPDNTQKLKREDIWYTTKLSSNSTYDAARKGISRSVKACRLGYIDLFLLHSPYGGTKARLESWRAIEDAIDAGEVKVGGISNFGVRHMRELVDSKPRYIPAINQIEVHPFNTRTAIVEECKKHGIVVEAYAPLARALRMQHPIVQELSGKYGVEPGQVLVRWSVQKGYVPLPKSVKEARIRQNGDVEGFVLEDADVRRMDALDEGLVTDWDPYDAP